MEKTRVVVIGGGLGDLCAGVKIKEAGIDDFLIFDRHPKVGGVCYENKYPGCCCDTQVAEYEFIFAPNPNWSHLYPRAAQIQAYAEAIAQNFQISNHLRLSEGVSCATWDEDLCLWRITTEAGKKIEANAIITALGQLNRPALPAIEGRNSFAGASMHSARWDDTVSMKGKRIGVIGSAASAVQLVPEVAKEASMLTVFQRSPNWIIPKVDREVTDEEKALMMTNPERAAGLGQHNRQMIFDRSEYFFWQAFEWTEPGRAAFTRIALNHLEAQVSDPELRKKLTPDYPIGCKRVLPTDAYYPALLRDNVTLVTDGISRINEQGIETRDGTNHNFDVLIYATGFETTGWHWSMDIIGRHSQNLHELWANGPEAYLGITVAEYPNLFMLYGPNTNLGHGTITRMLEHQVNYAVKAILALDEQNAKALVPTPEAQSRFNDQLQKELSKRVWSDPNCTSWYKNSAGHITQNWSNPIRAYGEATSTVKFEDYEWIS
jgi:cation diffusion facilitator CzcD-associated flavoprotein CzcO